MPELPEVEVTRRSFADRIAGAHIVSASLGKPLRWPLGIDCAALAGRQVLGVRRRGKYLLLDLSEGLLLLHLGMSGSLRFAGPGEAPLGAAGAHDHFDLQTTQGLLRLHDPRRFGAVVYVPGEDDALARKLLDHLGMEPLEDSFSLEAFRRGLAASRSPIKQLLLSGSVVVGVGNIYASEVLFLSRIHPARPARDIGPRKVRALHEAIRAVLALAVEQGGTTLRDFSAANGMEGHFQLQARVYGRDGQPCTHCSRPIRLMRQGQRSTYYCVHCQAA
ncbi:bifunctional DNA-formamidopyrimidine glycosylase/DNA-(apurinic or apyrimidinic site) lyase [Comamonas terrae]|uniref:Formamidopyrimidine-DNA glycosylase n=1 Tax=Comamonas terrae TaxID=673548 RepID=A0ABW5UGL0_9BURK|nr:bifunctional DNA-formamidopyrimidine glycosylase/DNA-(apurinic or apyrimidinic site) lyase [Comamonas terrae]